MDGRISGMDFDRAARGCGSQFLVTPPHEFEQAWIIRTGNGSYGEGDTFLEALEAAGLDEKNRRIAAGESIGPFTAEEVKKIKELLDD